MGLAYFTRGGGKAYCKGCILMVSQPEKKSRRSPMELCIAIFNALPEEDLKTKTQIAEEIGSKEDTVDSLLTLMHWIQEQPKVESVRVGKRRYGWKKAQEKKRRQTK
jgi:hypothetical protein